MIDEALVIGSLGAHIRIRCNHAPLRKRIEEMFAACAAATTVKSRLEIDVRYDEMLERYEITRNREVCWEGSDAGKALEWCAWIVNTYATETAAELVVHAAAASTNGQCILVTGPSGSGKSTLVSALTVAGLAYMGDDTVMVNDAGQALSNPKPISIDEDAWDALTRFEPHLPEMAPRAALLAPNAIGSAIPAGDRMPISLIVRPIYRADAPTRLVPLGAADAVELLADQSFNFGALGGRALRTIAAVTRAARAVVLEFSNLGAAVDLVVDSLDVSLCTSARRHPGHPPERVPSGFDVEFCDGEAFIWNRGTRELHHLSASATAIWRECEESLDADIVAASVVGSPQPSRRVIAEVQQCIDKLGKLGLVVRTLSR